LPATLALDFLHFSGGVGRAFMPASRLSRRRLRSTSETARVAGRSPPSRDSTRCTLNAAKLFFASHQVIVTFVLPKRAVTESEGFLGLVGRESFQGSQPLCQGNELSSEQVNVIRHDHKSMQLAALETHITIQQPPLQPTPRRPGVSGAAVR